MFSLPSFPKLLVIAAIIAVVWYFMRRAKVAGTDQGDSQQNRAGTAKGPAQKPVEDMVQCKSCGAYFPAKSGCSCGHSAN
ncbi:PP0621 family protein [Dongia sp.]|uniref:PP0621 family protein n=1 Tax=Dongia sp. TaxID=1977262 RepID=UPI0035B1E95A